MVIFSGTGNPALTGLQYITFDFWAGPRNTVVDPSIEGENYNDAHRKLWFRGSMGGNAILMTTTAFSNRFRIYGGDFADTGKRIRMDDAQDTEIAWCKFGTVPLVKPWKMDY